MSFGEAGSICISQDEALITVEPEDISELIERLEEAKRKSGEADGDELPTARRMKPVR